MSQTEDVREREIRLLLQDGTLYLDICEDGAAVFRVPMTVDDARDLARALIMAIRYYAEPAAPQEKVS